MQRRPRQRRRRPHRLPERPRLLHRPLGPREPAVPGRAEQRQRGRHRLRWRRVTRPRSRRFHRHAVQPGDPRGRFRGPAVRREAVGEQGAERLRPRVRGRVPCAPAGAAREETSRAAVAPRAGRPRRAAPDRCVVARRIHRHEDPPPRLADRGRLRPGDRAASAAGRGRRRGVSADLRPVDHVARGGDPGLAGPGGDRRRDRRLRHGHRAGDRPRRDRAVRHVVERPAALLRPRRRRGDRRRRRGRRRGPARPARPAYDLARGRGRDRRGLARHRLVRRSPPRERAVRGRRRPPAPVRARRAHRLRRRGAAREPARRRDRLPEPGRPGRRQAHERVRLRPGQGRDRSDAAGERCPTGAAAAVPAGARRRRTPDDGRLVLLPARRRPGAPRDQRRVPLLAERPGRARPRAGVRRAPARRARGVDVLQLRALRPARPRIHGHRDDARLRRRRHDLREGLGRPRRAALRGALRRRLDRPPHDGGAQGADPRRAVPVVRARARGRRARGPRAERGAGARKHGDAGGARRAGAALLPRHRARPGRRRPARRPPAGARGRGLPADEAAPGAAAAGVRSPPKTRKLPAGTYWIPLEQPQKRWVQAALGEDGYASVPYFYDVAAWSEPLAGSLDAWLTGAELEPAAELVGDEPRPTLAPATFYWIAGDTARSVGAALGARGRGHGGAPVAQGAR